MKLSTKIFAGFIINSVIFSAVSIVNFQLSEDVQENSQWVSRSQNVVRASSALQRNIIDMETGMRGFLLTGNAVFLDPYNTAKGQLPGMFKDLAHLVKDSPVQTRQLHQIKSTHERWSRTFAEALIQMKEKQAQEDSNLKNSGLMNLKNAESAMNSEGKKMMDSMRGMFKGFNAIEYQVREARQTRLRNSIQNTRLLSTFFTIVSVLIGLGWSYYIARLITRRIGTMVHMAEKISSGEYKTQIQDPSQDELSKLSASLNVMATKIDQTITELEVKNKELDQFAYVVSHDLKAPLRGIDNGSKWIMEDMGAKLPAHIQEYLKMMRSRVHRMENLINGILALARIGRQKQKKEEVNVKQLLVEVFDMLQVPPGIRYYIPDNLPVLITEKVYLQQVFSNLISNAIKYHNKPQGTIEIKYEELPDCQQFMIIDDGPGIDPEYHERIFVLFQTLQERDAVESTGVGLAIVKKIIDQQGGQITINSQPGQGSAFIFTWPNSVIAGSEFDIPILKPS